MACNCIRQINEALERDGKNTEIVAAHIVNIDDGTRSVRVRVDVAKRDPKKREKTMPIIAQFCPYCGVPYVGAPS